VRKCDKKCNSDFDGESETRLSVSVCWCGRVDLNLHGCHPTRS
jgi:hypothetical protein